jgi:LCP family protein required for cell wall assembly
MQFKINNLRNTKKWALICLILFGILTFNSVLYVQNKFGFNPNSIALANTSVQKLISIAVTNEPELVLDSNGRHNILILGQDHDEGRHTDVMTIYSIDFINKKSSLINLPRDILIDYQSEVIKLNSIAQAQPDKNLSTENNLINFIYSEWNIQIHNWLKVIFAEFVSIIDTLDGIDIDIENTFSDCSFPNDNVYPDEECLTFKQGNEVMNGRRAFRYARSRQSSSLEEGCDAARNNRQNQIIKATIDKLLINIKDKPTKDVIEEITPLSNYFYSSFSLDQILSLQLIVEQNPQLVTDIYKYTFYTDQNILCKKDNQPDQIIYCDGKLANQKSSLRYLIYENYQNIFNLNNPASSLCQ